MLLSPGGRPSRTTSVALLVTACFFLYVTLPNLGNVIRAATSDGVAGRFTAEQLRCVRHSAHESCEWSGTFRADNGAVGRTGVTLYGSGSNSFTNDKSATAVDVGNPGRVYRPQGSNEWIFTALLLLTGYGLLGLLAKRHLLPPPARHSPARQPT
ncbi:hypothetical protein ACIBLA_03165 [Streptomyces sp. NPDC050433]|uniref:hypothetical protein n=1 Tax=unclassified Streptomyces TaxID=2593676 RepID=UPI003430E634